MENEIYAPVCIIAYNRADKIKKVIESLAKNHLADKTRVYVFSDAPRDSKAAKGVAEVREYLRSLVAKGNSKDLDSIESITNENTESRFYENIESNNLDSKKLENIESKNLDSINTQDSNKTQNLDSIESKNIDFKISQNLDSKNANETIESNNNPPTILPFKSIEIIQAEHNLGIKDSIVKYANFIFKNKGYDRFIGLEDDIETHENFLQFMNDALQFYKDNPRIMAITAFSHQSANLKSRTIKNYKQDVLFTYAFHSWGWGTWRDRWENIDWSHAQSYAWFMLNPYHLVRGNILSWFHLFALPRSQKKGKISNLWDIYLSYIAYKQDKLVVWPARRSYTRNFGFDGSGVHTFNFDANIVNFSFDNPPAHLHFTNKMNLGLWFNFKLSMLYGVDVWVFGFFKMFVKKVFKFMKK
ncbi:hypothetical protein DCO58_01040 [Helicobacter saguini]|uniref:Glycosyltransferase 2-like domain-containing protein n=1 Tax=Helicobacter saguini TaxID=1548018 RepID=A0A347VR57_9HELI|nr:hypothetical protein [Helicobacter saguini]MWV63026.1 hypothetical protein [Helicobacter saguini]MWV66305.1 hypothetical protein [Helicobacter saguini]MWV68657.1 hypothetical protein [Helicobacter saguini]MWV71792.1 hypothetical protein [Helicobacter saguini]TLD95820.1 hypothetical protein LS64_000145 [Helicobacter saguini]